jgi:hypothetical protein
MTIAVVMRSVSKRFGDVLAFEVESFLLVLF